MEPTWRDVRRRFPVADMPDLPAGLNEVQYASLLFSEYCHVRRPLLCIVGAKYDPDLARLQGCARECTKWPTFEFLARYCEKCIPYKWV